MMSRVGRGYKRLGTATNFAGISKTAKLQELDRDTVEKSLITIPAFSKHRHTRKSFQNPFFSYRISAQWQTDLIDLSFLGRANGGHKFILTAIDVFSRFAFACPLRNKSSQAVSNAIRDKLLIFEPKIQTLLSDAGGEYMGRAVQDMLRAHGVKHVIARGSSKASICEAFNKTLQRYIFTYMSLNNTKKYIDKLPYFIQSYNNSPHRFFKNTLSPSQALKHTNEKKVLDFHNQHYMKFIRKKNLKTFNLGDKVRILKWRTPFTKGYRQRFSDEIFKVISKNERLPIPMFNVVSMGNQGYEDNLGEQPIQGSFYQHELSLID